MHDVGAQDDAGADARERRRLFIDRDREAGALQKAGGRQTAKARADDRNAFLGFFIAPMLTQPDEQNERETAISFDS